MSHSRILALGLAKERLHQLRQFLDAAQCTESQALHFILRLNQLSRNPAFDVRPNLLVGNEFGRVRWQVEQLEQAILGFDKFLDLFRLVDGMSIDDQNDRSFGTPHQTLEELPENLRRHRDVMEHETKLALGADRRNHVQRETPACHFHNGGLPEGRPSRTGVVVGADNRLSLTDSLLIKFCMNKPILSLDFIVRVRSIRTTRSSG